MNKESPLFSVIVLNWNGADILTRCLDALTEQTFTDYEVMVVDNASTDGSVDGLEEKWPGVQVVHNPSNLGFAAGNNRGAQVANGHWLAFLNNDAFPQPGWLEALAEAIQRRPFDSFFASLLVKEDNPAIIQDAGDVMHASGYAWPSGSGQPAASLSDELIEVFSACAAAVVYERGAFIAAGGFDEMYGSHLEDVDLGFRLRLAGARGWLAPRAVVAHIQSASYGFESDRTVYQVQRNVIWLFFADMPGRLLWKYLLLHLLTGLGMLIHYARQRQLGPALRARIDGVCGLPAVLRKRKQVQATRRVPACDIDRALDRGLLSPFMLGRVGRRLRWGTH